MRIDGFSPVCAKCREDPGARKRYGCSAPRGGGADEVPCFFCPEEDTEDPCVVCKGSGILPFDECPRATYLGDSSIAAFFRCYDFLQMGLLPVSGGVLDQPKRFFDLVNWAAHVSSELRKGD